MSAQFTRQGFLKAVGCGAAWIALSSMPGCKQKRARSGHSPPAQPKNDVWTFRSRPDLGPPAVEVGTQAHEAAPGYIFVAPKRGFLAPKTSAGQNGPMIIDSGGQPVWFFSLQEKGKSATDFKVQSYQGQPVLTWWEGVLPGSGVGEYVILDNSYREITRVRAGNGYLGDMHEFLITPDDTALLIIYHAVPADLSSVGGPKHGTVVERIVQELDIETGEVLFEWHSLEHVGIEESYEEPSENPGQPILEYFHLNSIDIDHDDNLLISAKKTFAVYKIDRNSGEDMWRLGGKRSDFQMGPGTPFAYQHDARRQSDGTITIFDNNGDPRLFRDGGAVESRGIVLELDEEQMNASLVREYTHPEKLQAGLEGNMQVLPDGNVFVGWGSEPVLSEFGSDGELLFDANFTTRQQSYRAFRFPWKAHPDDAPAAVAELGPMDEVTVYASWNGATEVATWEVLAGPGPNRLKPVKSAPRDGFETTITVHTAERHVAVRAKNGSGRVLGTARVVDTGG